MALPSDGAGDAGLPIGSRDVLPAETAELRAAEARLHAAFESFGYREVRTPALELDAVIDRAEGREGDPAYRLFDDRGQVLTLRPDPTVPVARLVATRLADAPDPVRVCYFGTAYRPPAAGRADEVEIRQAGVELVGAAGPGADAEVVSVLAAALRGSGLSAFRIVLGSVAVVAGALDGAGPGADGRAPFLAALRDRDHVAWRALVDASGADGDRRQALAALPTIRDEDSLEGLAARIPEAREAVDALLDTTAAVRRHGGAEHVALDLGVVHGRDYYSGIVIEAYADGVGAPIALGGRYDGLAARFGRDRAGAGVAVDVSRLHRATVAVSQGGDRSRPA
ncbi:MAG: ATP phosphoribosyltransferase regulatory subunit, partial [Miltoncostaeaceae bacterium]